MYMILYKRRKDIRGNWDVLNDAKACSPEPVVSDKKEVRKKVKQLAEAEERYDINVFKVSLCPVRITAPEMETEVKVEIDF